MATTKVIPNVLELNPGNPDYVLQATNAVPLLMQEVVIFIILVVYTVSLVLDLAQPS